MRLIACGNRVPATQRSASSRWSWRRGSEVLELALLIVPLMLLVIGCFEFGLYFFLEHSVQAAAREGARAYAVLDAGPGEATAKAQLYLQNAKLNPGDYSISTDFDGTNVTVTVEADWSAVGLNILKPSGSIHDPMPNTKKVRGSAVMRKESRDPP